MNDTFLRACRGEKVDYTPVWFMRQAGRYLPQYQAVRSHIDFLTLCKNPKFAVEVTLQPVDILGVDAAILFSDILIPLEPMGMHLEFSEKEGPVLSEPVRSKAAVDKLLIPDIEDELPFVFETIKILRKELENKVPLIGFSGAPFTLATYIHRGRDVEKFYAHKENDVSKQRRLPLPHGETVGHGDVLPLRPDKSRGTGGPAIRFLGRRSYAGRL